MGSLLTTETILTCPHEGTVTVTTTNTVTQVDGAFVLLSTDIFVVAGCSLTSSNLPPCTTIVWDVPAEENMVMGVPVLTSDSQGLCMGSAAPAPPIIMMVQAVTSGL